MKEIGSRISICRQNKNMTQEELARRLGVTSQAISKWERGLSLPDIALVKELCAVLEVSADYLLNVGNSANAGEEHNDSNDEILSNLRNSLDSLELIFGKDLVPLFLGGDYQKEIQEMRLRLSKEGMLLPVVRIRDEMGLSVKQFAILAYGNILFTEEISEEVELKSVMKKAEDAIRENYAEILSPDMMKLLTDNLKEKYPALIEGIVPETISYAKLTRVIKEVMSKGYQIAYLPKILEMMEYYLLDYPNAGVNDIVQNIRQLSN